MPTISKEDYLKSIYTLNLQDHKAVSTSNLAAKLEISNAAISEMSKKLYDLGLISYEKYKGVELTKEGKRIALKILRRHRLWELFMIKVLNLNWEEVHDEAEKLEHHPSDFLIDKIDEYLGFPEFDPHGAPIPSKDGVLPEMPKLIPLNNCEIGRKYQVLRVVDSPSELISYLGRIGMNIHSNIEVVEKLSFDNSIIVMLDNVNHSLSEKVVDKIFVKEIEED